ETLGQRAICRARCLKGRPQRTRAAPYFQRAEHRTEANRGQPAKSVRAAPARVPAKRRTCRYCLAPLGSGSRESLSSTFARTGRLDLAVPGRSGRHEGVDQPSGCGRDVVDGTRERFLIGPGRLREAGDLAPVLLRGVSHLL